MLSRKVDAETNGSVKPAMKRTESVVTGVLLAPLFILSSIYLFIFFAQLTGSDTVPLMLTGASVGVIFSLVWMPDIIRNFYTMRLIYIEILYIFCAVSLYLFMNLLPVTVLPYSLMIGVYVGRRSVVQKLDPSRFNLLFRHASIFLFSFSTLISLIFAVAVFLGSNSTSVYRSLLITGLGIAEHVIWLVLLIGISLILLLNYVFFMLGVRGVRHQKVSGVR